MSWAGLANRLASKLSNEIGSTLLVAGVAEVHQFQIASSQWVSTSSPLRYRGDLISPTNRRWAPSKGASLAAMCLTPLIESTIPTQSVAPAG